MSCFPLTEQDLPFWLMLFCLGNVYIHVHTVDREIFTLKIIRVKNFHVVKFSRSRSIREIFLTVDDCNMNERLESSLCLVYCQVSGEPGIVSVIVDWTFNSGSVDLLASLFTESSPRNFFFACLIFAVGLDRKIILTAKFPDLQYYIQCT